MKHFCGRYDFVIRRSECITNTAIYFAEFLHCYKRGNVQVIEQSYGLCKNKQTRHKYIPSPCSFIYFHRIYHSYHSHQCTHIAHCIMAAAHNFTFLDQIKTIWVINFFVSSCHDKTLERTIVMHFRNQSQFHSLLYYLYENDADSTLTLHNFCTMWKI